MPANFLHGVETIVIEKGARPITGVKTAVIGLIGTAPLYKVDAANRTVNSPTIIRNPVDAAKYFGTSTTGYTIPAALNAIFDQGNGPICIVVNVFDPDTHKTAVASEVVAKAANGTFPLVHPGVTSLSITSPASCVLGTDYTVNAVTGVISRVVTSAKITAGTASITVAYRYADPSLVVSSDIIGEVDANGLSSGLQCLIGTYNLFGFLAKMIIAPGYCTAVAVSTEMIAVANLF